MSRYKLFLQVKDSWKTATPEKIPNVKTVYHKFCMMVKD